MQEGVDPEAKGQTEDDPIWGRVEHWEVHLAVITRVRSTHVWIRSFVSLLTLVLIFSLGAPSAFAKEPLDFDLTGSSYTFKRKERCLMKKVNRARYNNGRRKLGWDKQMGYVARKHAQKMGSARAVYHDDIGSKITRWRALGQNVGRAGGCKRLFRAFMNSSGHRANILGSWKFVGVGVARAGGKLYAAQIFESRRDPGNIYNYP